MSTFPHRDKLVENIGGRIGWGTKRGWDKEGCIAKMEGRRPRRIEGDRNREGVSIHSQLEGLDSGGSLLPNPKRGPGQSTGQNGFWCIFSLHTNTALI